MTLEQAASEVMASCHRYIKLGGTEEYEKWKSATDTYMRISIEHGCTCTWSLDSVCVFRLPIDGCPVHDTGGE